MQDAMKRHLKYTLFFDFFSFHSSQVTFIKQNLGRPTCIYLVIIMYHTITIQCLYEMRLKSMYKERKGTISQI